MARALGFHRHGGRVDYALVERLPDRPPEVLATGRAGLDEIPGLYLRLAAGRAMPWALAEEREGQRVPRPGPDWPLQRPGPAGMLHPAAAAALYEWNLGRIAEEDLFLWLRAERLFWSRGEPGLGRAGMEARRAPLGELVQRVLALFPAPPESVLLAVEGDAPGASTLVRHLEEAGCRVRTIQARPGERGADRAAAGAAQGALEPTRPGVHPPERLRRREGFLWTAGILAALAIGANTMVRDHQRQRPAAPAPAVAAAGGTRPLPAPDRLERLLARRRAAHRALEVLPQRVRPGSLEALEILTAEESPRARVRLRLLPAGEAEPGLPWRPPEESGFDLETRSLQDGALVIQGEVEAESQEVGE